MTEPAPPRLGRNVFALSAVSLLTDVSSEMIYPLLPIFLTSVLGANASFIGLIEGAAETTAALLKLASGWWSDRVRKRKPLVVLGYGIASLMRPLVAIAQSATQVLVIRLADRVGKGIRNAPRDALLAESVHPSIRGRAFGVQRTGDHIGGVLGPLIAFTLLSRHLAEMRTVFWLAAIPGVLSVIVVILFVREIPRAAGKEEMPLDPAARAQASAQGVTPGHAPDLTATLDAQFWRVLVVIFVFTLGNSTDAFLLLRANQLGVPVALAPILWAALHVVKSASSVPGGALSDRIGRRPTLIAGWLLYAAVYVGFARAGASWQAWALFGIYGLFFGLTEGSERALVADLVVADRRGTAFGWYNLAIGLGALPASILFGFVWDHTGASAAFLMGATFAALAAAGLMIVMPAASQQP
ncbi:MAG: MFS transporter [Gemmatimonadota bacterium]|nr:MFS transporter [Gemmatimonadota bacterium]